MKLAKIFGFIISTCCLYLAAGFDSFAIQYDYVPVKELPKNAKQAEYIALTEDTVSYEVKKGDTLWGISRAFLGTGTEYETIFHENGDIISNPALLMPGQVIRIPQKLYIPRDRYDRGGLAYEGAIRIALPDMVDNDLFLTTDIGDVTYRSGITIFSLPVTNRMGENALTQNWADFTEEVQRCSEECGGRVSNLYFEKYKVENGCDLCGYSFDFDAGDKTVEFAAFYRLGAQNMAEVIGVRIKEQDSRLVDVTRYIAASFEDFGGSIGMGYTKMTDNVGACDWKYPELHNLFTAAMTNYIDYAERPEEDFPGDYEIRWKEPMFEQAVRNALIELWHLDGEEKESFLNRPVMASDTAVITSIQCTFYPTGYPYAREDSKDASAPVLYFVCNGHYEKLYPEENSVFSYEDLAHFGGVESLEMSVPHLSDYSFIGNMPHLRELSIWAGETVEGVDFLAQLKELRTLSLQGASDFEGDKEQGAFSQITDMKVLENCPELRYLFLQMPHLTDFSFLKKCQNICTIELSGSLESGEPVIPDITLLPNARFIEFYGESFRFDV